jgi:hypothetical protein
MPTTYQVLADSETEFNRVLSRLGIPLSHTDRIHIAFALVSELAELVSLYRTSGIDEKWAAHEKKYKKGEPTQALLDIREVANFIPFLHEINDEILKTKLTLLIKGNLLRIEESEVNNNSVARNTQFELFLFSQLRSVGIDAELCDPNPDVKVFINGRTYYIECKRILRLTATSVNTNSKKALRQLNEHMDRHDESQFGVVALSVQRILAKPEEILNSHTQQSGLDFIQNQSYDFIEQNNHSWQNPARLKNSRIASVWVHFSGGIITKTQPPLSSLSNLTMTNAWRDARNLDVIKKDFAHMEGALRKISNK